MGNTCNQLLGYCLRGEEWPSELLDRAIAEEDGRVLLSVVVERLGDLFEPRLCAVYERLFRQVIHRFGLDSRLRTGGTSIAPDRAERVYVLSRITLGADVAVTSVMLDAAKKRYPSAEILFVGPRKNFELFEADPRITHRAAAYARGGSLRERLDASAALWFDDGIVIDPDSRLTQLGLIGVCDPDRYFFFESRSYGGDGADPLPELAARWAGEVFGVDARSYVAPRAPEAPAYDIAVSLGVGENAAKRIGDAFERELFDAIAETGASVLVDKGASAEEHERVERVLRPGMQTHDGPFAPFAAQIARAKLYVGYDSSGGHVAAASGVPLVSIFAGEASERMFQRWRPKGTVLRGRDANLAAAARNAITCTFRR